MITTNMQTALQAVQNNEMTISEASERFNVDSDVLAKELSGDGKKPTGDYVELGISGYLTGDRSHYYKKRPESHSGINKTKITEFQSISFNELINELGGRKNMPDYLYNSYKAMYNKIAGEDGIISASELKKYLKNAEKFAGEDKILDTSEMKNMLISRGEEKKDGPFVDS